MFYVLYATVEEEHGLARHAMNIYERKDSLATFRSLTLL